MIIHDFECQACGTVTEKFIQDSRFIPEIITCPACGSEAKKIVSISQTSPVDAAWIKSVLEVVDKESYKGHTREFLKHPTRANYKAWMNGEGLRSLEPGEGKNKKVDPTAKRNEMKKAMNERYRERNAISVNT